MRKHKKFDYKYKLLFLCQINVIKTYKNEINGKKQARDCEEKKIKKCQHKYKILQHI